jgi:hypothetical protein
VWVSSVNNSAITDVLDCTYNFRLKVPKCENFD